MITRRTQKTTQKKRRAGAVVEFAVVAPILVFLILGMIELARGLMVKEALTDAARRGCRSAILPNGTTSGVNTDVTTVLSNNSISTTNLTTTILVNGAATDVSKAPSGAKISVKVSIPVADVAWITPLFLPSKNVESETVTMLNQR
jgi:Flp pilus assembly protein TadG